MSNTTFRIHSYRGQQREPYGRARPSFGSLPHQPGQGLRRDRLRGGAHTDRRSERLRRGPSRGTGGDFRPQCAARGAKVFRTSDPQAVNRYILDLARQNGVESVVKSKSMASEEIHLNSTWRPRASR